MREYQRQGVMNEARARGTNESIEAAVDVFGGSTATDVFLCECSDSECRDPISVSRREYEAVRAEPTWFVIAPNHENPELDRVVEENDRFTIVEKWAREGAWIARSTDPRSDGSPVPG